MGSPVLHLASYEEIRRVLKAATNDVAAAFSDVRAIRTSLNKQGSRNVEVAGRSINVRAPFKMSGPKETLSPKEKVVKPVKLDPNKTAKLGTIIESQESRLRMLRNIQHTLESLGSDTITDRMRKDVANLLKSTKEVMEQAKESITAIAEGVLPLGLSVSVSTLISTIKKSFKVASIKQHIEHRQLQDGGTLYVCYLEVDDLVSDINKLDFVIAVSVHSPAHVKSKGKAERLLDAKVGVYTEYVSPERLISIGRGVTFTTPAQLNQNVLDYIDYQGGSASGVSPISKKDVLKAVKEGEIKKLIYRVNVDDENRSVLITLKAGTSEAKANAVFGELYSKLKDVTKTFNDPGKVAGYLPRKQGSTYVLKYTFTSTSKDISPVQHSKIMQAATILGIKDMNVVREIERVLSRPV